MSFNIVALYKTFSGEDFVAPSIESIYDSCYKIVFVHSRYSWTGEEGNTVAPVVETWKAKNDKNNKIVNLYTDISQQSSQYDFGFAYIKKHFHECDFVMLIDTDEVWDNTELKKAIDEVIKHRHEFDAFNIKLHTYVKSLLFRISPPEWCQPTVFVKSSLNKLTGIRGSLVPKRKLLNVFMHHFTYVRFNEQEVIDKVYRTAATEKVGLVDMKEWVENKWNKLPYATNFHTVDYAAESWQGIEVIDFELLPESIKNKAELFSKLLIKGADVKPLESVEAPTSGTETKIEYRDLPVKGFKPVKLPDTVKEFEIKQCARVGVNLTWKCNWSCQNCFYRYNSNLHKNHDEPFDSIKAQIDSAKKRGCDHAVAIGFGEPSLYGKVYDFISYCNTVGLTSSIITNGATGVKRFAKMYEEGINHLHVSVHHVGDNLDKVAQASNAGKLQKELKEYLRDNKLPWRSNTTLQADNYRSLPDIMTNIIEHGAFHIVLLGFLPHYEWSDRNKASSVLISPKNLRPFIEESSRILISANKLFTIRYQPFCHLSPDLWKYVTNARYVIFDPWEWEYGNCGKDMDSFKSAAEHINSCGIKQEPCSSCAVKLHCGGWNKTYADLCGGADLRPISRAEVPYEYLPYLDTYGGIHVLNPANRERGYYVK